MVAQPFTPCPLVTDCPIKEGCQYWDKSRRVCGFYAHSFDTANVLDPIVVQPSVSVKLIGSNPQRMMLYIYNFGPRPIWIKFQPAAVDDVKKGILLASKDFWESDHFSIYTGEVSAIGDGGSATVYVTEH